MHRSDRKRFHHSVRNVLFVYFCVGGLSRMHQCVSHRGLSKTIKSYFGLSIGHFTFIIFVISFDGIQHLSGSIWPFQENDIKVPVILWHVWCLFGIYHSAQCIETVLSSRSRKSRQLACHLHGWYIFWFRLLCSTNAYTNLLLLIHQVSPDGPGTILNGGLQ